MPFCNLPVSKIVTVLPLVSCMLSFSDIPTPPSAKRFHSRSHRCKRLAVIASLLCCLSFVLGTSSCFWHFIEFSFAQFLCHFRTSCIFKSAFLKQNWSISIWQILFGPHHCIPVAHSKMATSTKHEQFLPSVSINTITQVNPLQHQTNQPMAKILSSQACFLNRNATPTMP